MIWQSPLPLRTLCRHPWRRKQKHQLLLVPCQNHRCLPFHRKITCRTRPLPRKRRQLHLQPRKKDAETQPPAEPLSSPAVCETTCENIMQLLVEEKADQYMTLFGLCRCSRCRNDVLALALNQLPPKYVVMPVRELTPRLSIYEGRFNSAVTAQILRACKEVLEHPRHDIS